MKSLRAMVLMQEDFLPPDPVGDHVDLASAPWKMEYDVIATLEELGHEVLPLGVDGELEPLRTAIDEFNPDIVFNLLEEFRSDLGHVPFILGYLELLRRPYTGCNPRGMTLATGKSLQRGILRYHNIPAPDFAEFPIGQAARRPGHLQFPLIVKSATQHGSVGISQASVVHDDKKLRERVEFIHEQIDSDAIVEEFIEGRELYVGVLGNDRVRVLPVWEMVFDKMPAGVHRIATSKVKWDEHYQKKIGLKTRAARGLSDDVTRRIHSVCRRTYKALGQTGYARMDLRLTPGGDVYLLESNPNPQLAYGEDFAESASADGLSYNDLIQKIVSLGMRYHAARE